MTSSQGLIGALTVGLQRVAAARGAVVLSVKRPRFPGSCQGNSCRKSAQTSAKTRAKTRAETWAADRILFAQLSRADVVRRPTDEGSVACSAQGIGAGHCASHVSEQIFFHDTRKLT